MVVDEARIAFLMKKLGITREEALDLEGYDEDVNKNRKTQYDLTEEQRKNVMDMNRRREHRKSGPRQVQRKPNEVKEALVVALADFLENECEFMLSDVLTYCDAVEITNKNRMIHFKVGEKEFDLQLIEKRAPKAPK